MGVAADCAYVEQLGSQENATRQILTSWNSASTLFKVLFLVLFHFNHTEGRFRIHLMLVWVFSILQFKTEGKALDDPL